MLPVPLPFKVALREPTLLPPDQVYTCPFVFLQSWLSPTPNASFISPKIQPFDSIDDRSVFVNSVSLSLHGTIQNIWSNGMTCICVFQLYKDSIYITAVYGVWFVIPSSHVFPIHPSEHWHWKSKKLEFIVQVPLLLQGLVPLFTQRSAKFDRKCILRSSYSVV